MAVPGLCENLVQTETDWKNQEVYDKKWMYIRNPQK